MIGKGTSTLKNSINMGKGCGQMISRSILSIKGIMPWIPM